MAEKASDAWYAEIANYDWKTGGPNGNTKIARGQIGHFTALVWQQTNKAWLKRPFSFEFRTPTYFIMNFIKT